MLGEADVQRLSAVSAALDLAPLSQTPPRAFNPRAFEGFPKSSEWPRFPPARGITSPLPPTMDSMIPHQTSNLEAILTSRKGSPNGMADSIASLPAMPSKSVPGTPFGVNGITRRQGTSPGEGLSQAQRGFSNPDLAKAFSRVGSGFSMSDPPQVSWYWRTTEPANK